MVFGVGGEGERASSSLYRNCTKTMPRIASTVDQAYARGGVLDNGSDSSTSDSECEEEKVQLDTERHQGNSEIAHNVSLHSMKL